MSYFTTENNKNASNLIPVSNLNLYCDKEGKLELNIFNDDGSVVNPQGTKPSICSENGSIYLYADQKETSLIYLDKEYLPEPSSQIDKNKRNSLEKELNKNVVHKYESALNSVHGLFEDKAHRNNRFRKIENVIEDYYRADTFGMTKCISSLRTSDTYTHNHSLSVSFLFNFTLNVFKQYQNLDIYTQIFKNPYSISLTENNIKKYTIGALLHDYGKLKISLKILHKPTELTPKEFSQIKMHPMIGVEELKKIDINDQMILDIVGNHHPAYQVFPYKKNNPLAEIANIIDIYDACRSERPYKAKYSYNRTLSILKNNKIKFKWNDFIYNVIIDQVLSIFEIADN